MKYVETQKYLLAVENRTRILTGKAELAINLISLQYPLVTIYLYGSLARQDLKPNSDIDLMVIKPKVQRATFDEILIINKLQSEQCGWAQGVDINFLDLTKPNDSVFFNNINTRGEAILIYQNEQFSFPWKK